MNGESLLQTKLNIKSCQIIQYLHLKDTLD